MSTACPAPPLAVALLTGGQSTRMGQDKAHLLLPTGEPLWQNRLHLLQALNPHQILISCRPDQHFSPTPPATFIHDTWENGGPLSGIVSCLEAMQADRLLVLAVDLPNITLTVLQSLLATPLPGGAVFRQHGFLEPLVALYPKSMAPAGRRRLDAGHLAPRDWIAEAGPLMRIIETPSAWAPHFLNVNDPTTWQHWQATQA